MAARDREADERLAEDQLHELNTEFYGGRGPSAYFRTRLAALALVEGGEGECAAVLERGVSIGRFQVHMSGETDAENGATAWEYAAIESEVLFHHVAESLFRMLFAHVGNPPCPWLEIARLRHFRDFSQRLETEVRASDRRWRTSVAQVLMGSDRPPPDLDRDLWDGIVDSACEALDIIKERFTAEHVLYNAMKHGAAVTAEPRVATIAPEDGDPVVLGDGPAAIFLEQRQVGSRWAWHKSIRWVDTDSLLFLVSYMLQMLDAVWTVARTRYAGVPATAIALWDASAWATLKQQLRSPRAAQLMAFELPYYAPPSLQTDQPEPR